MSWLPNPFSRGEHGFWLEVRRGALEVVAASQRFSALWFLQTTSTTTTGEYIKGDNPEARQRRHEIFGCDSITVTWTALVALEEIFGSLPSHPSVATTLTTLYQHRSDHGGYGTATGWRTHQIFATCRHTATALLSFLQFRDSFSPPLTFAQCKESANWLLGSALPNGGWPFARQTDMDPERDQPQGLELLSTACVITALCEFLRRFPAELGKDAAFLDRIEFALKQGFAELQAAIGDTWHKSERSKNDVFDAAFITEMLCMAYGTDVLPRVVPGCGVVIRKWCESLIALSLPYNMRAWPKAFGSAPQPPSLAATLSMAVILFPERYRSITSGLCGEDQVASMIQYLAQSVRKKTIDGKDPLDAWDWINLARASHAILRQDGRDFLTTVSDEGSDAFKSIHTLRSKDAQIGITRQDLTGLPKFCRSTVAYILTYGRPERIASNVFDKWYQARHPMVRRIIDGSVWSAVAGAAFGIWQSRNFILGIFA